MSFRSCVLGLCYIAVFQGGVPRMCSVVVPPARFMADLLYIFPELEYHEKELCMQSAAGVLLRRILYAVCGRIVAEKNAEYTEEDKGERRK